GGSHPWTGPIRFCFLVVLLGALLPAGARLLWWQKSRSQVVDPGMARAGEVLFHHEWTPNDPLSPDGDGLGPVYNATSCVACHNQGGSGGSGSRDSNVTTVTVNVRRSGFLHESVVHSHAIQFELRETLGDVHESLPNLTASELSELVRFNLPRGTVSDVNAPALFGSGLIDAVPDQVLIEEEKNQRSKWEAVKDQGEVPIGRLSRLP